VKRNMKGRAGFDDGDTAGQRVELEVNDVADPDILQVTAANDDDVFQTSGGAPKKHSVAQEFFTSSSVWSCMQGWYDREHAQLVWKQFQALMTKNLTLKKRAKNQTCCEILTPVLLTLVISAAWGVSLMTRTNYPATIYANQTLYLDQIATAFSSNPGCVVDMFKMQNFSLSNFNASVLNGNSTSGGGPSGGGMGGGGMGDDSGDDSGGPGGDSGGGPGGDSGGGPGGGGGPPGQSSSIVSNSTTVACVPGTLLNQATSYAGPYPMLPFDLYVSLSKQVQNYLKNNTSMRSQYERIQNFNSEFDNFVLGGRLSFAPNTTSVRELISDLNKTSSSFGDVFYKLYNSESDAVNDALQTSGNSDRHWAVVVFNQLDIPNGKVEFTIRMNYSVVPYTSYSYNRFAYGSDTTYQKYFISGFLSIQNLISEYVLTKTNSSDPLSSFGTFTAIPFPTRELKNVNSFYDELGYLVGFLV
jgi:hypothetical protein